MHRVTATATSCSAHAEKKTQPLREATAKNSSMIFSKSPSAERDGSKQTSRLRTLLFDTENRVAGHKTHLAVLYDKVQNIVLRRIGIADMKR